MLASLHYPTYLFFHQIIMMFVLYLWQTYTYMRGHPTPYGHVQCLFSLSCGDQTSMLTKQHYNFTKMAIVYHYLNQFPYVHIYCSLYFHLPATMKLAESWDGLLLDTVHWYSPPSLPVTVRVWVYCAVVAFSNTVTPPETTSESLVQVTVVAGPPVEVQVKVNWGLSTMRLVRVMPLGRATSPEERESHIFQSSYISSQLTIIWRTFCKA